MRERFLIDERKIFLTPRARYVLVSFMSGPPATADAQTPRPDPPQDPAPTLCPTPILPAPSLSTPTLLTRTLIIVRKIIAYSVQMAATLKQGTTPGHLHLIALTFSTGDIAEIAARIARALHIAAALEARLLTYAGPPERPLPAARLPRLGLLRTGQPAEASAQAVPPDAQPADGPAEPAAYGEDTAASRLARLPSAEELAKMLRHRPIGAIIADLCLELGIRRGNSQWHDLFMVILENGGNPHRLFTARWKRWGAYLDQSLAKHGMTRQTPLWPPMPQGWSPGAPASFATAPP